jgi:hypothetical protein
MRDASTYRCARRNRWRADKTAGSWGANPYNYYNGIPQTIRRSYISKRPSKYMPHDGGGKFVAAPNTSRWRRP